MMTKYYGPSQAWYTSFPTVRRYNLIWFALDKILWDPKGPISNCQDSILLIGRSIEFIMPHIYKEPKVHKQVAYVIVYKGAFTDLK